jgi:hypothetical protein
MVADDTSYLRNLCVWRAWCGAGGRREIGRRAVQMRGLVRKIRGFSHDPTAQVCSFSRGATRTNLRNLAGIADSAIEGDVSKNECVAGHVVGIATGYRAPMWIPQLPRPSRPFRIRIISPTAETVSQRCAGKLENGRIASLFAYHSTLLYLLAAYVLILQVYLRHA